MDNFDELFTKDGWIITTNTNGKTKVASCDTDETNPFNKTRDNWVTLCEDVQGPENRKNDKLEPNRIFRPPFQKIASKDREKRVGFYLIRDLLNMKKPNSLTKAFLADNIPLTKVMVCARITSYTQKDSFYRLILDDGTSSILCMVQIRDGNVPLQQTYCEEDNNKTSYNSTEGANSSLSWALNKLTLYRKKLREDSSTNFDQTSLGRPVRIVGYLREFCGKNFIFAFNFKWISEKYFLNYLSYIVQCYEYKENYIIME